MKYLTYVPSLLAVTAGLAVLALRLLRRAQERGRSGLRWMAALLGTWLGVLALAALGARAAYVHHYRAMPGFWTVYVPAVVLAFGAAFALGWILSRLPSRAVLERKPAKVSAPAVPTLPPAPAPIPVPPPSPNPPAVTTFKFACPHCGQRLAVTTADIGTTANCPNCASPLTVPSPPPAPDPG